MLVSPTFQSPSGLDTPTVQAINRMMAQIQTLTSQLEARTSGDSQDIEFASGMFNGGDTGAQVWTVTKSDCLTLSYRKSGHEVLFQFWLQLTTVSGTPSTELRFVLPFGWTALKACSTPMYALDNGTRVSIYAWIAKGSKFLNFTRQDAANWSASTNATFILGQIAIEIEGD